MVEGGHRIEAACRILQGYKLGDPLPLVYDKNVHVSLSSTLFKSIPTRVYYYRKEEGSLIQDHLSSLQKISEAIANNKEFFLEKDWKWWWTELTNKISGHAELKTVMFEYQSDFYKEDVNFRAVGRTEVKTVQIRTILHEILTDFIFNVRPCKNLLQLITKKKKPTVEDWKEPTEKWCHLTCDPYQLVSNFSFLVHL